MADDANYFRVDANDTDLTVVALEFVDVLLICLICYLVYSLWLRPKLWPPPPPPVAASSSSSLPRAPVYLTLAELRRYNGTSVDDDGASSTSSTAEEVAEAAAVSTQAAAAETHAAAASSKKRPVYVSVRGVIYDVSSRADLYGVGGIYQVFAGREAARALAKESLDTKDCDDASTDGLFASQLDNLTRWELEYSKYEKVGRVVADVAERERRVADDRQAVAKDDAADKKTK
jgi:membrane-associated progesterone receptor component